MKRLLLVLQIAVLSLAAVGQTVSPAARGAPVPCEGLITDHSFLLLSGTDIPIRKKWYREDLTPSC